MATLTSQAISLTGLAATLASAASGGDQFANSGRDILYVSNGGSGGITVTVNSQAACNFGYDHDVQVAVDAGAAKYIGPFPTSRFNNADGNALVTYSGVTSVQVAVLRLPY